MLHPFRSITWEEPNLFVACIPGATFSHHFPMISTQLEFRWSIGCTSTSHGMVQRWGGESVPALVMPMPDTITFSLVVLMIFFRGWLIDHLRLGYYPFRLQQFRKIVRFETGEAKWKVPFEWWRLRLDRDEILIFISDIVANANYPSIVRGKEWCALEIGTILKNYLNLQWNPRVRFDLTGFVVVEA